MDGEQHPRTGVTGLAWRIDQFLRAHIGWPYRWILSVGLVIGLSGSATSLAESFNARTFASLQTAAIAIASAVFPEGTTGAQLDPLARFALWQAGVDFDHGTGHGVGSYLSVHEGPARLSKLGTVALKRGMILSNEPGYYKTGAYGIRIENLVLVTEGPTVPSAEKPLNAFETLTLVPIDRRLVDKTMLTPAEANWLDDYHGRVETALGPVVDPQTRDWLANATRRLG